MTLRRLTSCSRFPSPSRHICAAAAADGSFEAATFSHAPIAAWLWPKSTNARAARHWTCSSGIFSASAICWAVRDFAAISRASDSARIAITGS